MMQAYDIEKMKGWWLYCHVCDKKGRPPYAYSPKAARDHMVAEHGKAKEFCENWWPDEVAA